MALTSGNSSRSKEKVPLLSREIPRKCKHTKVLYIFDPDKGQRPKKSDVSVTY